MSVESYLPDLAAFGTVILIDIVLAADNALVVGMAAVGIPAGQRRQAILLGIFFAMACRIGFSLVAVQIMQVIGLLLAGGLLLLWVSWKLWRELRSAAATAEGTEGAAATLSRPPVKSFGMAVWQITLADVSMSLDNVIAVAGAARENWWALVFGLALSIALMGVAAVAVARLLQRHRWLAYLGLLVITYVSLAMIFDGGRDVFSALHTAYAR